MPTILDPGHDGPTLNRRTMMAGTGAAILGLASPVSAEPGMAAIVDPAARLRTLHSGGRWMEGPAWDSRRGALICSDVKRNVMLRIDAKGTSVFRTPSNNANGNCFDSRGRLLTCEHRTRRVVRQEADGRMTVLADRYQGRRLNSPNDLAVAPDGAVWFTDPIYGITVPDEGIRAEPEQPGRFVYRIDCSGALTMVEGEMDQPNGIVFSPDGRTLYISETGGAMNPDGPREILAFDVVDGRRLARRRVFARLDQGIPDGLAVDRAGRVYAGVAEGAGIWSANGERLGTIPTPKPCANIAFGGRDGRTLYLCATDSVHAIALRTQGLF
ncbi:SMP-30/gluconolactonase/LRE family protein [Sphingomonas sp. Marseille-Q8236]